MDTTQDEPETKVSFTSQSEYDVRFEWGLNSARLLSPICDAIVIVDVLSFTTCVDIAAGNGARVYPYPWKDVSAAAFAGANDAILASFARSSSGAYSLSPASLASLPAGSRFVLPSPNGSTLSLATGTTPTFAGCLRNAAALGAYLNGVLEIRRIGVIAAGEKWEDGTLRPAIEDMIGAGAILGRLTGPRSPEAEAAIALFEHFRGDLRTALCNCTSGRELIGRGFPRDVELAAALNVSTSVPQLADGCYTNICEAADI